MMMARARRKGATSLLALSLAALLPAPVLGEIATAQVVPDQIALQGIPVVVEEPIQMPVLSEDAVSEVESAKEEAPKTLEDSAVIGEGVASYYGAELAGNRTANGERFNPNALTAAHRTLPMGTKLKVTNKANGKSVIVRINDRGPFAKGRIIDVSRAAAEKISMIRSGTARVVLERIS